MKLYERNGCRSVVFLLKSNAGAVFDKEQNCHMCEHVLSYLSSFEVFMSRHITCGGFSFKDKKV